MSGHRNKENHDDINTLYDFILKNDKIINQKWYDLLNKDIDYGKDFARDGSISEGMCCDLKMVLQILEQNCKLEQIDLSKLMEKVRSTNFSISDLHMELSYFQHAIEEIILDHTTEGKPFRTLVKGLFHLCKALCEIHKVLLQNTSLFYELAVEKGRTGFCQIDIKGRIIYANKILETLIKTQGLKGMAFDGFFSGDEKRGVQDVILTNTKQEMIQQVQLQVSENGKTIPVGLELGSIFLGETHLGAYARVTDISEHMSMQQRIFDDIPIGIVQLDRNGHISYTNQNFRDLLGLECNPSEGMSFDRLIPDKKNKVVFQTQLADRWEGKSSEYDIRLSRHDDKREIPVRISASPIMNQNQDAVGTLGIIRSIVSEHMHQKIKKHRNATDLLAAVASDIRSTVPYDALYISFYSPDGNWVRPVFRETPGNDPKMEKRWWKMNHDMLMWASKKEIQVVTDIEAFYNQEEFIHLRKEDYIQHIIRNYNSFIYYPVFEKEKLIASAILYSSSQKPYSKAHERLLKPVPLWSAILSAIHYEKIETMRFNISLFKKIADLGKDLKKIACLIVKEISIHYQWENVSIFRADKGKDLFSILAQHTTSDEDRIPDDYTQPLKEGILGKAYKGKKAINVPDVTLEDLYIFTVKKTQSELCIPIETRDLFWALNIEDSRTNAFSQQELESLQSLTKEICVFLEKTWLSNFMDKSVEATSDAVIRTDFKGLITTANRSALDLLGYRDYKNQSEEKLSGRFLSEILKDKKLGRSLIEKEKLPNMRTTFVKKNGDPVNVLLSKFKLHEEFSTNIIIAKDLSLQERVEDFEYLNQLYSEIAFLTQTPLALISIWLKKVYEFTDVKGRAYVEKAIKHLGPIELSFTRLALMDTEITHSGSLPFNKILISIKEIEQNLKQKIPDNELERVIFNWPKPDTYIRGDLFQISFCFETILSYLFRSLAGNGEILVELETVDEDKWLNIDFSGPRPNMTKDTDSAESKYDFSRIQMDMALGIPVIRKFIENHSGIFNDPDLDKEKTSISFSLPVAKEVDHV